jgi:di/tricarboxylate transporter
MNPLSLWDSLSPVLQGEAMTSVIVLVFALTYVGMALGRIPGLRVDRSGIAMVAAVVLVAVGAISTDQIVKAIHFPTLLLMGD